MEVPSSMEWSADLQDLVNKAIKIYADKTGPRCLPPLGMRGAV